MRIRGHGLGIDAPPGWEVRIRRRPADVAEPGGRPRPVLHAATIPLPDGRADYGSDLLPVLGPEDVFIALFEFEPEATRTALFARRGRPRLTARDFDPSQLQRTVPGLSGSLHFFSQDERAFSLYVVLGSHARRAALVPRVNAVLDQLTIDPGAHP